MGAVDERAQIVRCSVNMVRREKIDTVVAPAEISREIGDRHHFDDADSDSCQFLKLFGRGLPRSFFGKSADVHFINGLAFHFHAPPIGIAPAKLFVIDNARGTVRSVRLRSRSRIRMEMLGSVYAKPVERTRANLRAAGKISALLARERMKRTLGIFVRAFFQDKIDILRFWRPNPEMGLVWLDQLSADRISAGHPSLHELTLHKKIGRAVRA